MKSPLRVLAVSLGLFCATTVFAQTPMPAAKPAAAANSVVVPAAKESAAPAVQAPATRPAKTSAAAGAKMATPTTAAMGGGNGKVWVNAKSKTYYCEGSKFYGKTKAGEYMTEVDAKAQGNHADHGKACSK